MKKIIKMIMSRYFVMNMKTEEKSQNISEDLVSAGQKDLRNIVRI